VMIQAGHDTGSHDDQPWGHRGQIGGSSADLSVHEVDINIAIRNKVLQWLGKDSARFEPSSGDAWDASAGKTADAGDDINWAGDIFISIHCDPGSPGSFPGNKGHHFGFTRGSVDGWPNTVSANSKDLADKISGGFLSIPDYPPRMPDNSNFYSTGGVVESGPQAGASGPARTDPDNATGWGYYAWGSSQRKAPNDVKHIPTVPAAILIECGKSGDLDYLQNKQDDIASAIYRGICGYLKIDPKAP